MKNKKRKKKYIKEYDEEIKTIRDGTDTFEKLFLDCLAIAKKKKICVRILDNIKHNIKIIDDVMSKTDRLSVLYSFVNTINHEIYKDIVKLISLTGNSNRLDVYNAWLSDMSINRINVLKNLL